MHCVPTLALVLALAVLPGPPRQDAPPAATCATCAGKGVAVLPCEACEASGKSPCPECAVDWRRLDLEARLPYLQRTDPARAQKVVEASGELERTLAELGRRMGAARGVPEPGQRACPATCAKGQSFLNRGHACKVCKAKGFLKCSHCKGKGKAKCYACHGKRERAVPCPECLGTGSGGDPLARGPDELEACPWCGGDDLRACHACDAEGRRERDCPQCHRVGKEPCRTCLGTSEALCRKCSGTGDLSSYFAAKSSNRCDVCKGKGVLGCETCERGVVECDLCAGRAHGPFPCELCFGVKQVLCPGCVDGRGRAWVVTAERLLAAGRAHEAVAHLEVALRREEARAERVLAGLEDEDAQRERRKELDRGLKELRQRLARARKEG